MAEKTGVIHGRFQCLHLKHMEYLMAAKNQCKRLIIGISNPDAGFIRVNLHDKTVPNRRTIHSLILNATR